MYDVLLVDVDFAYSGRPLVEWLRSLNPKTPLVGMMTDTAAQAAVVASTPQQAGGTLSTRPQVGTVGRGTIQGVNYDLFDDVLVYGFTQAELVHKTVTHIIKRG